MSDPETKSYPAPGWDDYAIASAKIVSIAFFIAAMAVGISLLLM